MSRATTTKNDARTAVPGIQQFQLLVDTAGHSVCYQEHYVTARVICMVPAYHVGYSRLHCHVLLYVLLGTTASLFGFCLCPTPPLSDATTATVVVLHSYCGTLLSPLLPAAGIMSTVLREQEIAIYRAAV